MISVDSYKEGYDHIVVVINEEVPSASEMLGWETQEATAGLFKSTTQKLASSLCHIYHRGRKPGWVGFHCVSVTVFLLVSKDIPLPRILYVLFKGPAKRTRRL